MNDQTQPLPTDGSNSSESEAANGFTASPSYALSQALDHPLAGYVVSPAAGALFGAATHPLQGGLHRLSYSAEDREKHSLALGHLVARGAGIGLGMAISRRLRTLHHQTYSAWHPPVAARLLIGPLAKHSRAAKKPWQRRRSTASGASRQ